MTSPATRRRQARLARRMIGSNGRFFQPYMPVEAHGLWSGYNYWGCQCVLCDAAGKRYYRESRARKRERVRFLTRPVICTGDLRLDPPPPPPLIICAADLTLDPPPPRDPVSTFTWTPPPMTSTARAMVESVEHLEKICRAYYEPEAIYPDPKGDDRVRRRWGDVAVTVVPNGMIIYIAEAERGEGPPTFLAARARGLPKARGGRGGRRTPTSVGDIIDALRKLKVPVERNGTGHWRVTLPDGGSYSIPATPSGGNRSIPNTVADLRRFGVAL